jgi:hypothetical protein
MHGRGGVVVVVLVVIEFSHGFQGGVPVFDSTSSHSHLLPPLLVNTNTSSTVGCVVLSTSTAGWWLPCSLSLASTLFLSVVFLFLLVVVVGQLAPRHHDRRGSCSSCFVEKFKILHTT